MHNVLVLCLASTPLLAAPSLQDPRPPAKPDEATSRPMGWTGVLGEEEFAALHDLKEGEAPKLLGRAVKVGDAEGYLCLPPDAEPTSGILVIHEWWGLNDHIRHWADRLAGDGYAALAIDLYGGVVATNREEAMAAMNAVDADKALATLLAAHRFLAESPQVNAKKRACVGWCFGGGWSLRLAMAAPDLDAAVIYYGRLVDDPEQLAAIRAPVLGVFGNEDRGIPPQAVDAFAAAMEKAGKKLELHRYDAEHAFANPSSARYDQENAARAWHEVRQFLREHLTGPKPVGRFSDGSRELEYEAPEGWKKGGDRAMRAVTFTVGDSSECYVAVLAGTGGGIEANLNRWRQQMEQPALSAEELAALPHVPVLGRTAPVIRIEGRYVGMSGEAIDEAVMLGIVCPLADETVFVKMIGPASEMAGQEEKFEAFCVSLR